MSEHLMTDQEAEEIYMANEMCVLTDEQMKLVPMALLYLKNRELNETPTFGKEQLNN